jgi:hypothetical protein
MYISLDYGHLRTEIQHNLHHQHYDPPPAYKYSLKFCCFGFEECIREWKRDGEGIIIYSCWAQRDISEAAIVLRIVSVSPTKAAWNQSMHRLVPYTKTLTFFWMLELVNENQSLQKSHEFRGSYFERERTTCVVVPSILVLRGDDWRRLFRVVVLSYPPGSSSSLTRQDCDFRQPSFGMLVRSLPGKLSGDVGRKNWRIELLLYCVMLRTVYVGGWP